jgi:hypothetical protein
MAAVAVTVAAVLSTIPIGKAILLWIRILNNVHFGKFSNIFTHNKTFIKVVVYRVDS